MRVGKDSGELRCAELRDTGKSVLTKHMITQPAKVKPIRIICNMAPGVLHKPLGVGANSLQPSKLAELWGNAWEPPLTAGPWARYGCRTAAQ